MSRALMIVALIGFVMMAVPLSVWHPVGPATVAVPHGEMTDDTACADRTCEVATALSCCTIAHGLCAEVLPMAIDAGHARGLLATLKRTRPTEPPWCAIYPSFDPPPPRV